ncbi:MAG: alpha-mannosidase [Defluviitaleaceae bacterium]|nr:alpha-mannosidase [Defluviitaleaceae bacterium]
MKKVHLIGNAHIDPVWLWKKPEGYSEILATFRSALDRMDEFPGYIFTSACAAYYKWIEQVSPAMFEEIKSRVKEGRWCVAGGFWIQPDCNIPSGEAFARHVLYSQGFFREKFGIAATVGYNVDSFGHNGSMPMILKKAGMDSYVFMRPDRHENTCLPENLFKWQSPDGSSVTAYRISHGYGSGCWAGENEAIRKTFAMLEENKSYPMMSFYGIGNHGGGPTIDDLKKLSSIIENNDAVCFSSPTNYFEKLRDVTDADALPLIEKDLQHHASGCYAANASIKAANRRAENMLIAAEKYDNQAEMLTGMTGLSNMLKPAWERVMFNQFHDILAGCSIREAYTDALNEYAAAEDTAAELTNLALHRISWNIKTTDILDKPSQKSGWRLWTKEGEGAPVVVFNPHSFAVSENVQLNTTVGGIKNTDGKKIAHQTIRGPQTNGDSDKFNTIFTADVPAYGYSTYFLSNSGGGEEETGSLTVTDNSMENEYLKVTFDLHTGYITGFYDKKAVTELAGVFAKPVVIDDHRPDTWSHGIFTFDTEVGCFTDAELKVTERGPLRACIRVTSKFGMSVLVQDFYLHNSKPGLEVRVLLTYNEKLKILKLSFNADRLLNPTAAYSMPYGFIEKPANGEEEPSHEWAGVFDSESGYGLALLNDGKYSFSAAQGDLRMNIARGCFYADHYAVRDDLMEYQDQGEQRFRYAIMPINQKNPANVVREAFVLNTGLTVIPETHHDGKLSPVYSGIEISNPNIVAQVVKFAEDKSGTVIRLQEINGKAAAATCTLSGFKPFNANFNPQEVKTFLLDSNNGEAIETDLTEKRI